MRELDAPSLYGNISGWIGFFLGYSLFQIPSFFLVLYRTTKKCLPSRSNKVDPGVTLHADRIILEEHLPPNIEDELKKFNKELFKISQKFQKLHDSLIRNHNPNSQAQQ